MSPSRTDTHDPISTRDSSIPRAEELRKILNGVTELIVSSLRAADQDALSLPTGFGLQVPGRKERTTLLQQSSPEELKSLLPLSLPAKSLGIQDLISTASNVIQNSINTSCPGFLDKLYSSPSAPGIAADLLLSALNVNSHIYKVSPALTHIEKHVASELAGLFGLPPRLSGGITMPGGSAANLTAVLVARNVRFSQIKIQGMNTESHRLIIFVSEASHYSLMNAAQIVGIGTDNVRRIPTTDNGAMDSVALEKEIRVSISCGHIPLFVAATAGTTVRGAFDPLEEIGKIAHKYGAWFHVDACWGGATAFSEKLKHKLSGSGLADSVAFNPHKMLGVPLTCSFLLARDLRTFWLANRLLAGYLFHENIDEAKAGQVNGKNVNGEGQNGISSVDRNWRNSKALSQAPQPKDIMDLASLTGHCGRRPDALKLFLHWRYYGKEGMGTQIEAIFDVAHYLACLVDAEPTLRLIGDRDVPCAQVCFYYCDGKVVQGVSNEEEAKYNSIVTRRIVDGLLERGWMIDYAPGSGKELELGEFIRVACNKMTTKPIAEGMVRSIVDIGRSVSDGLQRTSKIDDADQYILFPALL
ncbi:hypothetical protein ACMFMG_011017 [Clarireedia jacksonii]